MPRLVAASFGSAVETAVEHPAYEGHGMPECIQIGHPSRSGSGVVCRGEDHHAAPIRGGGVENGATGRHIHIEGSVVFRDRRPDAGDILLGCIRLGVDSPAVFPPCALNDFAIEIEINPLAAPSLRFRSGTEPSAFCSEAGFAGAENGSGSIPSSFPVSSTPTHSIPSASVASTRSGASTESREIFRAERSPELSMCPSTNPEDSTKRASVAPP